MNDVLVLEFNNGKYDLNLIKNLLMKQLSDN